MIVKYKTPEERRLTRIKLYKDDVFLIAHETLKKLETKLPLVDLFASADAFTSFLLSQDISERDIMQYEIDDLREELSDDLTFYILLTLSFIKLCALRKVKSNAENVARALVVFCQEYDGFTDLLGNFNKKEKSRWWYENKRADLLTYELKCIEKGTPIIDGLAVVTAIVEAASEGLSADSMLPVEVTLTEVDKKLGNPFKKELERFAEKRRKKSVSKIEIEKVNDIHDNPNVTIGGK